MFTLLVKILIDVLVKWHFDLSRNVKFSLCSKIWKALGLWILTRSLFFVCGSVPYKILSITVQRDETIISLFIYCKVTLYMFRVSSHPSSGVHKTVTTTFGTGHIIGAATSFQRGQVTWPRWNKVAAPMIWPLPKAVVTVLCTPDYGCDDTRNMYRVTLQ